ncbi:Zinc finger RING-CH-type [Trinorchestia longiramus]|nr:Zinc finger RING-CH-type [Trinorchestia longiramus]
MAESNFEEAPLLGGLPSPSLTASQPSSPAVPSSSTCTLQVPSAIGNKIPKSQTSMDSGCESDAGETDPLHPGGAGPNATIDSIPHVTVLVPPKVFQYPFSNSSSSLSDHSVSRCSQHSPGSSNNSSLASPHTQASPASPNPTDAGISSEMSSPCTSSPYTSSACACSKFSGTSPAGHHATSSCPDVSSPCDHDRQYCRGTTCGATPESSRHSSSFCNNISSHDLSSHRSSTHCRDPHDHDLTKDASNSMNYGEDKITSTNSNDRVPPAAPGAEDLSSKVTFRIEGDEGEEENNVDGRCLALSRPVEVLSSALPRIPSYTKPSFLSSSSSTTSMPFCRICHLPEGDGVETLISPCRCSGTMEFIHHGCLMKWLEVSGSRSRQLPTCELCNYQFHRRKKFRLRQCQMPTCSRLDKILHSVFLVCLLVMVTCSAVTVVCFKQNSNPTVKGLDTELTSSEVVTLTCGVLFFVAFFVAMYVEVKATDTFYRLCTSFFYINQTMHIYEYDKKRDTQYTCGPSSNAPV